MAVKAVIFDYIGTLVNCRAYTMEASKLKLYNALADEGFEMGKDAFLEAYDKAHEKYRLVRFEQLREVTNTVWVAEALREVGYKTAPDDKRIQGALNVFFKDYVDSLFLREGAKKLIKKAMAQGKTGLLSNFTHAPVVYASLHQLGINGLFSSVVVSEQVGWRKPSPKIFSHALCRLGLKASEAVYVGDNPIEDVKGAKAAGLRTVFVASQFNTLKDLEASGQKPDFVAEDLAEVLEKFSLITS